MVNGFDAREVEQGRRDIAGDINSPKGNSSTSLVYHGKKKYNILQIRSLI